MAQATEELLATVNQINEASAAFAALDTDIDLETRGQTATSLEQARETYTEAMDHLRETIFECRERRHLLG